MSIQRTPNQGMRTRHRAPLAIERTADMRSRIRKIAAYRRAHSIGGLFALALIAALTLAGATRAQDRPDPAQPKTANVNPTAGQPTFTNAQIHQKLEGIILPHFEFRDATVREALAFLKTKSAECDMAEPNPVRRGISIILTNLDVPQQLHLDPASPLIKPEDARLTMSLTNVPLIDAFRYVTELTNLKFRVARGAVEVLPINAADPLLTMEWKVSPATGFKPDSDPKESLLASGVRFPTGAMAVLSSDGSRLVIKNSQENLDLVDDLLAAAEGALPESVVPLAEPVSAVTSPESEAAQKIEQKLNTIIIPQLEFRNATVRDTIDFLKSMSVELDTEPEAAKRGVNIELKLETPPTFQPRLSLPPGVESPTRDPVPTASPQETRITTPGARSNIPLLDALKFVTGLANLKVKVESHAVYIVPMSDSTEILITKEWKLNEAMLSALGIRAGRDARQNLSANGVNFPRHAMARWVPVSKRLIMRNTQENVNRVDALLFETQLNEARPCGSLAIQRSAESSAADSGTPSRVSVSTPEPFMVPVPGRPGFYIYPGEPNLSPDGEPYFTDCREFAPGTVVQSQMPPHKHYRVPLNHVQTRKP